MKVFATAYLESFSSNKVEAEQKWAWSPENEEVQQIYASGAPTSTTQSTYAQEKDNRNDSDRPNEGMLVA